MSSMSHPLEERSRRALILVAHHSLAATLALKFVVWFAPNVIANAVAVSFMGMFLVRYSSHCAAIPYPRLELNTLSLVVCRVRYSRW